MTVPSFDAKEIFLTAIDCATPEALQSFLSEACGDAAVRQRVEGLLRAYEQAGNFLGGSASFEATANMPPASDLPMRQIGPYKLLQQIGEGGMGLVYMAEQTEPIHRKVALKLVKNGLENKQAAARFEAERQALALMEHQNIAKVLDAGTTESGQPYFVMELVHGLPITKYCDQHRLSPRQRLELFIPVCQAVQHAHQKGIIHRDLKPSNVLIALFDGQPVPKVIDFGVAKALGQKLTDKTMFTEFGAIVGTLEYMSPEQAEKSHLDVDTRSDIYSLGVLLYELLTGTTPLDRHRMKSVAILELLRIIKEEEPQKPSTRLSTIDTLASIAANRSLEPKKLSGIVRGELDWIVMKALEKDRNRRYETANGFAADVQRYLTDEPVVACPPSAKYRFEKFARRNKALLTGVISVAVVLIGGATISTLLAIWALRAEGLAENRLVAESLARQGEADARRAVELERDKALAAEHIAAAERDRAEVGFAQARVTVDAYLTQVSQNQLLTAPGLQPLRRELLQSALDFYQDFLKQRGDDPTVQADLAATQYRVSLVYDELGMNREYQEAIKRAKDLFEALHQAEPNHPEYQHGLAKCLGQGFDRPRAISILEGLVLVHPERDDFQRTLAEAYNRQAVNETDPVEKLRLHRLALAVKEQLVLRDSDNLDNHTELGLTFNNIGTQVSGQNISEAIDMYRRAAEQYEIVYARSPHLIPNGRYLAMAYANIGICQVRLGDEQGADVSCQRATDVLRRLALENAAVPVVQAEFLSSVSALARRQRKRGQMKEADQSVAAMQQVMTRLPRETAIDLYNLACFHALYSAAIVVDNGELTADEVKEAEQEANNAVQSLQQAVARGFSDLRLLNSDKDLDHLRKRADFQAVVQQVNDVARIAELSKSTPEQSPTDRLESETRALDIRRALAANNPQIIGTRSGLGMNYHTIGVIQADLEQWEPATASLAEACRLRVELVTQDPDNIQYQLDLASTLGKQSEVAERQGFTEKALAAWNEQLRLLQTLDAEPGKDAASSIAHGDAWYARGYALWASGQKAQALPCWESGFNVLKRGYRALPNEVPLQRTLARNEFELADFFGERGYFQLAGEHCLASQSAERYLDGSGGRFAIVTAWMGKIDEYRETCRMLAEQYSDSDLRLVAWVCSLLPDSSVPPERVLAIAEDALRRDTIGQQEYLGVSLARARYRLGQFERPVGTNAGFLAPMVEWQLGNQDAAKKLLYENERQYAGLAEQALAGMRDAGYRPLYGHRFWWEELASRLIRKEAWELIEGRVPAVPQQLLVDALLWSRVGDKVKSEEAMQAAIDANPDDPDTLAMLAHAYSQAGDHEQSLAFIQQVIDLDLQRAESWILRGRYHLECGNHEQADADFTTAATLTPDELNKFITAGMWASTTSPSESNWFPQHQTGDTTHLNNSTGQVAATAIRPVNYGQAFAVTNVPNLTETDTVYAMSHVYSAEHKAVTLLVGGPQWIELSLNGRSVFRWQKPQYYSLITRVPVLLHPGRNTLIVRIPNPAKRPYHFFLGIADSRLERGLELASFGFWEDALPLLKAEFDECERLNSQVIGRYPSLLLATGNVDGYRDIHQDLMDWFGERPSPDKCLFGPFAATLAPVSEQDALRLVQLVDEGVAKSNSKGWPADCQPQVYFRAGRYQEVLDRIGTRGGLKWSTLRSLCSHYLGDREKAKVELARAEREFMALVVMQGGDPSTASISSSRHGVLDLAHDYVLLGEARNLIAPESSPADSALHALLNANRERLNAADPRLLPFEMALIYEGKNPLRWLERGRARAELGQWNLAEEDFAKAISLAPDDLAVLAHRVRTYADLDRVEEAALNVVKMLDHLAESSSGRSWTAPPQQLCADLGQWPDVLERVTALKPDDARLWIGRARHHLFHSRWQESSAEYTRAEDQLVDPDEWVECAAAHLLAGDTVGYARVAKRMLDQHSQSVDPAMKTSLALTYSLATTLSIEAAQLVEWASLAGQADPKTSLFPVALAHYRGGQWDRSLSALTVASQPDSANAASRTRDAFLLAMTHHHLGDSTKAGTGLQQATVSYQALKSAAAMGFLEGSPAEWVCLECLSREALLVISPAVVEPAAAGNATDTATLRRN